MFKFLKRLKEQWWLVALIVILICGQVVFDFMLPTLMGNIIKEINVKQGTTINMQSVFTTSIWMLVVAFSSGLCAIVVSILSSKVTSKMMARVRYELYAKISSFSAHEMNSFSISSLITRTTNDITNIANTYVLFFRFVLYGPLLAVGAFAFLAVKTPQWQFFLSVAGAVLLLGLMIFAIVRICVPKFNIIQQKIDNVNLVTKENLEGLRVVRAYNAEGYQKEKFSKINDSLTKDDKTANRVLGAFMPAIQLVIGLLMITITLISAHLLKTTPEKFKYEQMTVVIQFATLLLTGFVLMVLLIVYLPRASTCAKRINEVLESPILVKDNAKTERYNEVGTIEFKDVTFTYPGGDAPSLQNISFKVNKGETLAFIGATGAGKTTLLNLILRFYDTTKGTVLVDGLDVKKYNSHDLFNKFGYVPQKPYLFHAKLKENVCLGRPDATKDDLMEALEISQSTEFVSKLTNGIDYEISQGGKNVSGGQRQRLSIARAIVMKPEMFIFDDSFSALDYKTDKVLRGEIKKRCKGTTNVIVAQRVGTIMDADQIVVLDNGKMVGIGTHKELLKKCKVYKEIALSQLSKEELE